VCDSGGNCINNGTYCHGKVYSATDWNYQACWTCAHKVCDSGVEYQNYTTCCDCSRTGCGTSVCIAWSSTMTVIGRCATAPGEIAAPLPAPPGTVVGVATGDPATSWGMQPPLAP
jgi:hypothetical protein